MNLVNQTVNLMKTMKQNLNQSPKKIHQMNLVKNLSKSLVKSLVKNLNKSLVRKKEKKLILKIMRISISKIMRMAISMNMARQMMMSYNQLVQNLNSKLQLARPKHFGEKLPQKVR